MASLCPMASSCASPRIWFEEMGAEIPVPSALVARIAPQANGAEENRSRCVKFSFRKDGRYAGEFCASSDPDFLASKGIVTENAIPKHSRPAEPSPSGLVATTAANLYPLKPFGSGHVQSFAATTDCDESNEAVYRPTASCHVAVATRGTKHFYSSFIVKSETRREARVPIKDIEQVWRALRERQ